MVNPMNIRVVTILALSVAPAAAYAQSAFFSQWQARATETQSRQPGWSVPLITQYSSLIQVLRTDFTRQITAARSTTWNDDNSKGMNLIPFANTEIDFNLPSYIQHNVATAKDGAGYTSFALKYRPFAGNEQHGSYVASVAAIATIPTGSYSNGSTDATIAPTLGVGKGIGRLDMQSCANIALPTGDTSKLGRPVTWNAVLQYHLGKYAWPEIEQNSTYYRGGKNDGKVQTFVTPGFIFGKIKFQPENKTSRIGLALGAGMQIATSTYHATNHNLVFTARYLF
jgi:hypothetical protein